MNKNFKEINELIAVRVPPGDRWNLVTDSHKTIYNSLTEVIEMYFMSTKRRSEYRFSPMEGKLYVIKQVEEIPEPPRGFNIYGDPM
jgi:hypothetical protein